MTTSSGEASASSRWRYEAFEIVVTRHSSHCAPSRSSRTHCAAHHSGLLRFFVNEENMMLKLILILSSSLALASTECCR